MASIFSLFGKIFIDNTDANKALENTSKKASDTGKSVGVSFGNIVSGAGKVITAAAGIAAATVAAAVPLVNMASEAEDSFAKVKTLLTGSQADMDAYYDDILAKSTATGVSFSDYSEAVYSAISASVDAADAVGFVADAVQLAKGGFTDTTTAVDVLTTALNAYGLEADQASYVSDILIGTQNLGKTTVDELASSMGAVIPTANAANVQIDNLSAAYALMTKNGVATAQSGTQIKAMLGELSKTGSKSDAVLREVTGHSFAELEASGYNMADALNVLQEYADSSGVTLKDLFSSTEAGSAALIIAKNGGEEFNEILGQLQTSAGATAAAYETVTDTLSAKLDKVKNAGQNLLLQVGNKLLPAAADILDLVLDKMPQIGALVDDIAPTFTGIVSSLLPALLDLAQGVFPVLLGLINKLLPLVKTIMASILPAITKALQRLEPLLLSIADKLLPLIVDVLDALLPVVVDVLGVLGDAFLDMIEQILPVVIDLLGEIVPIVLELAEMLLPVLLEFIRSISSVLSGVIAAILPVIITLLREILPIVVQVAETLLPVVIELIREILPIITGIFEALSPLFDLITEIIKAVMPIITELINKILPVFIDIIKVLADLFKNVLGLAIEKIATYIQTLKTVLSNIIDFVKNVFAGNWKGAWDNVKNIFSAIWDGVASVGKNAINGLIWIFEKGLNGIIGFINTITSGLSNVWTWTGLPAIPNIPTVNIPRLSIGMDYVPFDDFPALLHKGERVLRAGENKEYTEAQSDRRAAEGNGGTVYNIEVKIDKFEGTKEEAERFFGDDLLEAIQEAINRKKEAF